MNYAVDEYYVGIWHGEIAHFKRQHHAEAFKNIVDDVEPGAEYEVRPMSTDV